MTAVQNARGQSEISHACILCGKYTLASLGQVYNRRFHNTPVHHSIPTESTIYQCTACAHTQKYHDQAELAALQILYDNYTVGNFSLQVTQSIFLESEGGHGQRVKTREEHILDQCGNILAHSRDILDVGCGTGSFLRRAAQRFPSARLHAYEVTESFKDQLLAIQNVVSFHSCALSKLPANSYDCITLWQCLEHLDAPGNYLQDIRRLLTDNGHLLIQVPDLERMPFDLAVFEHWSHFCDASLISFAQAAGFEIVVNGREWVHNCSTVLLKKSNVASVKSVSILASTRAVAARQINWLNQTAKHFQDALSKSAEDFLILGVGTAAGWLYGLLNRRPIGFLEEDRSRIGMLFDQIEIIAPEKAPPNVTILVPFTPVQASEIKKRLCNSYPNLRPSQIVTTLAQY